MMDREIKAGDLVWISRIHKKGIVATVTNTDTEACYIVDFGGIVKYPARREWLTLLED